MLYQFRIDRTNKEEIVRRLREHNELSQGWGGGKEISLDLNTSQFVEECTKYFELKSTRVPSNLTRMRDLQDGDILVTPHLPTEETLTLTVVDGDYPECYRYDESDSLYLNHRIKVKKDMIFGLTENISLYNHVLVAYLNSMRWFRLPVLPLDRYSALFVDLKAMLEEGSEVV